MAAESSQLTTRLALYYTGVKVQLKVHRLCDNAVAVAVSDFKTTHTVFYVLSVPWVGHFSAS